MHACIHPSVRQPTSFPYAPTGNSLYARGHWQNTLWQPPDGCSLPALQAMPCSFRIGIMASSFSGGCFRAQCLRPVSSFLPWTVVSNKMPVACCSIQSLLHRGVTNTTHAMVFLACLVQVVRLPSRSVTGTGSSTGWSQSSLHRHCGPPVVRHGPLAGSLGVCCQTGGLPVSAIQP